MFGIGEGELVLILLFAFLVFGPDKLPGMGRTLGRALRQFRNAQEGFTQVVQTEIVDPATEAMSDNPKRPNRKRTAALEEDADIDEASGEGAERPKRTETFAERKKRLAAEKAARDAEAAAAATAAATAAESESFSEEDADSDADAEPATDAQKAPEKAEPAPAPTTPVKPTAADLYAMRPTPKPRPATGEAPAEAEAEPAAAEHEPEPAAPEPAPTPADDAEKEA